MSENTKPSVVMLGATGAVGGATLKELLKSNTTSKITLLGRREVEGINTKSVSQYKANIFEPTTYEEYILNQNVAICTLGVGEPSKISKEEFIRIDKNAVVDFAKVCKSKGIEHFQLLSSVGINSKSSNFFLRTKGELVEELEKLNFQRLSIFQPSMIITPSNRYGFSQALVLTFWPIIDTAFIGSLKKYKGIKVEELGSAIAANILKDKKGVEFLSWKDFQNLLYYSN